MATAQPSKRGRRVFRRAITFARGVTPNARLLGLLYEEFSANGTEYVWVTNEVAADVLGATSRTVSRARAELVAAGWLVETERAAGTRAARFRLAIPDDLEFVGGMGPAVDVPADAEPGQFRMIPGAQVQHDGGPVHRVPAERSSVTPFRRRGDLQASTPTWTERDDAGRKTYEAPECDADGSILRRDGSCPVCSRLQAVAR